MSLEGRKVLVTGACGFIGSHLAERLVVEGATVRAFVRYDPQNSAGNLRYCPRSVRQQMEIVHGDLRDGYSVLKAVRGMEAVFHLGALISIPYSYQSPMDFVQTNVIGTTHVLQAGLECRVQHVILTSSSEVYGTAQQMPITEQHPLVGQSPYSASKIAAEKLAESFACSYGLPLTILRPFNTYGARQSARAIIPSIISQALFQERVLVGSLEPRRDFNFVEDIVEGFVDVCDRTSAVGQVYNLGSGKSQSMREVAEKILGILEVDCPIEEDKRRVRPHGSEVWCLEASAEKARQSLGWEPRRDFSAGISATIPFIAAHPEIYDRPEYLI